MAASGLLVEALLTPERTSDLSVTVKYEDRHASMEVVSVLRQEPE